MAYIECNTIKLREDGNTIINLVDNLNEVLNEYYNRIEKMATTTGEWTGPTANNFIASVLSSKKNTMDFCNSLMSYGKYFVNSADQITDTIKRNSL